MKELYNYSGDHIAWLQSDELYSVTGRNIGHYVKSDKIFIDMKNRYLGQILHGDRLLEENNSSLKSTQYPLYPKDSGITASKKSKVQSITRTTGYSDIPESKLT